MNKKTTNTYLRSISRMLMKPIFVQNQTVMPAVTSKPSSSKDVKDPEHHPTGKPN